MYDDLINVWDMHSVEDLVVSLGDYSDMMVGILMNLLVFMDGMIRLEKIRRKNITSVFCEIIFFKISWFTRKTVAGGIQTGGK